MNHIHEGADLMLRYLNIKDDEAIAAYIVHPMLQNDEDLKNNIALVGEYMSKNVLFYALEYRNVTNRHLLGEVGKPIKLSVIPAVNDMLCADKVQNYKDFRKYHLGTHEKSDQLVEYFEGWLQALNISKPEFEKMEAWLGRRW